MPTLAETFQTAVRQHQAGQLSVAEELYRQILALQPQHAEATHLLGVIAHQRGQNEQAVKLIEQALGLSPNFAEAWNNLGSAFTALGQLEHAIRAYRTAISHKPSYQDAQRNLQIVLARVGERKLAPTMSPPSVQENSQSYDENLQLALTLRKQGDLAAAVRACQAAIRTQPNNVEGYHLLQQVLDELGLSVETAQVGRLTEEWRAIYAESLTTLGIFFNQQTQYPEAVHYLRIASALAPKTMPIHYYLGDSLCRLGQAKEAIQAYEAALSIAPNETAIHNGIGIAWAEMNRLEQAAAAFRRGLELMPLSPLLLDNLCKVYQDLGSVDEAINVCQQALSLNPQLVGAHNNLGNVLKSKGDISAAIKSYRRATELGADRADIHSNLLFALNFCPETTAAELAESHQQFQQRHAAKLLPPQPIYLNQRDPNRPLRIGYVSPDFNRHPVGRFMLPLLEHHDRQSFHIYGYASVSKTDEITADCRRHCHNWRDVRGWSDERVTRLIAEDQIDILVDLSMHTAGNRLLVFARKPAPVQVTYLAYFATTGLTAIDYRFTDPYFDPPGENGGYSSEELIRLPGSLLCYHPIFEMPPLAPLPALSVGHIMFGCLNNFSKVSESVVRVWGELLKALPNSRLLLHARPGEHRERAKQQFHSLGIFSERIEFVGHLPMFEYFRTYDRIDIALDPFPYGGGTTTCDALWMGVPVICLAGKTASGRGGVSILSNIGLADFVAADEAEYVQKGVQCATDLQYLADLRSTMRQRMLASPLMDAPQFARNVESAYRTMWQRYCEKPSGA